MLNGINTFTQPTAYSFQTGAAYEGYAGSVQMMPEGILPLRPSAIPVNPPKSRPDANPHPQNARPVRTENIRMAQTKWYPLNRRPIFRRMLRLPGSEAMSRSMFPMLIRKQHRTTAKLCPVTLPFTPQSARNADALMYRAVRLPHRLNILMKKILIRKK